MTEAIISAISNICQSTRSTQHKNLLDLGLIDLLKVLLLNYCPYGYLSGVKQSTEQIDAGMLSIGNVNLLKSISSILQAITKSSEVQEQAIKKDIISVLKHCNRLKEYEVLTNLYLSFGNLLLSHIEHVRRRAVELGCLSLLLETNENSEFLRIRRICNSVLQQTNPQLFEYNESL